MALRLGATLFIRRFAFAGGGQGGFDALAAHVHPGANLAGLRADVDGEHDVVPDELHHAAGGGAMRATDVVHFALADRAVPGPWSIGQRLVRVLQRADDIREFNVSGDAREEE
ncbi:MAG: hypothetical protein ACQESR_12895 [Planctomycetota bacterium]